jgi:hypothetical protein
MLGLIGWQVRYGVGRPRVLPPSHPMFLEGNETAHAFFDVG